ncbi:uncharacterized protein LOC135079656 [Ostrinia nubilalis]|uniref:uncharacterized protein LOC135079656 n=1 Tax=Ostrinia nubilalis TaxID=29057 RepID=UPI003082256E
MPERKYAVACALVFLLEISCVVASSSEDKCIDYYQTGDNFDLNELEGSRFVVYFWPPNQRQRSNCEVITFKKLSRQDVETAYSDCKKLDVSNQTVVQASYVNNAGKSMTHLYYGDVEVKRQYRTCERISKYIFKRVSDNYVMGINCSAGGRGLLLSKTLPSASEVQSVADQIEIMSGREGSPDCKLSRR